MPGLSWTWPHVSFYFAVINENHECRSFPSSVSPSSNSLNPSQGSPTTMVKEVFMERRTRTEETRQTSGLEEGSGGGN